jgi:hypothetical protein
MSRARAADDVSPDAREAIHGKRRRSRNAASVTPQIASSPHSYARS